MSHALRTCSRTTSRQVPQVRQHVCNRSSSGWYVLAVVVAVVLNTASVAQPPWANTLESGDGGSQYPFTPSELAAFSLDESASGGANAPDDVGRRQTTRDAALDFDDNQYGGNEEEGEEDENEIEPIVEELFLGTIVYPQEQNEVQLTFGYFDGVEAAENSETLFEIEYGLTDRLQIGFEVPNESVEDDEPFDGVRHLGLELYYNFYSNPYTRRAYGAGFEVGFPIDSAEDEPQTYLYEPFVVAYQEYRECAVNLSAGLEIEAPHESDEPTETAGEVALGIIGNPGPIVPLLELHVEIEADETPVRLAPGLYFGTFLEPIELAVSFPIGLNSDAPDFAVFFLAIVEFEANDMFPRRSR